MSFDRARIPRRRWVYQDDPQERYGIDLGPEGVSYWAEIPSDDAFGGGGYREGFRDFLRRLRRGDPRHDFIPREILEEIRALIEAARR